MKVRTIIGSATAVGLAAGLFIANTLGQRALGGPHSPPAWDDSAVQVELCLGNLPDGGVRARIHGMAPLMDGGEGGASGVIYRDLAGAARTNAQTSIDNAKTTWVNAQP